MSVQTRAPAIWAPIPIVHRVLPSFPIACFTCALLTDLAYAATAQMMWADFSAWLLAVGFIIGALAAVIGLIGLLTHWRVRAGRPAAIWGIGGLVVLALAGLNNLVHSRDAWTSVMPMGLVLSVATVAVMLLVFWLGSGQNHTEIVVEPRMGAGI